MRTTALNLRQLDVGTHAFAVHRVPGDIAVVTRIRQDEYEAGQFGLPDPDAVFVMAWGGRPQVDRIGGRPLFGDVWLQRTSLFICLNDGEDFTSRSHTADGSGLEAYSRGNWLRLRPEDYTGTLPSITMTLIVPGVDLVNGVLIVQDGVREDRVQPIAKLIDPHFSISHNASAASSTTSADSITYGGLTIAAGSDICLLGHFANSAGSGVADISTFTWAGTAFSTGTGAWNVYNGQYQRCGMRYLVNPATGAQNLIYTATNVDDEVAVGGTAFDGVDQTTPCRTPATTSGIDSAAFASVTPTTVAGDEVVNSAYGGAPTRPNYTSGAGQTPNFDINVASFNVYASDRETATGTSTTMSATWSNVGYGWVHGATPLIPAGAAATLRRYSLPLTGVG